MSTQDPIRPRNILVITYWSLSEGLIQAYVLPYLAIIRDVLPEGSTIHLITMEKGPVAEVRLGAGIVHHPFKYRAFGTGGALMLMGVLFRSLGIVIKERIDVLHAWCTPAGMIGYLLARLTGKPLVIDSFEPHAEAMVENGTWEKGSLAFKTLFLFERLQTQRAHVVIAAVEGMRDYALTKYGSVPSRFHVKPACVDLHLFSRANKKKEEVVRALGLEGKLVAVYAGKFGGIYLDQDVFHLFRAGRDHWGERFHVLLLTSHSPEALFGFMQRAGTDRAMFTIRQVPHAAIADFMGVADLAITPVKPVPTKRYCSPIKDGEYWALGLPVIITPGISDDSAIIEANGIGTILRGSLPENHRRCILEMDVLLKKYDGGQAYERIRPVAERYRTFAIAEAVYGTIYGPGTALWRS